MKTFIQNGNVTTVTAPAGGATANHGLLIGNLFGIATCDALAGESVEIATTGVFDLNKSAATVIGQGVRVAWDDTAREIALSGVGLYPVGIATLAAGDSATTVTVRLDGIATVAAET